MPYTINTSKVYFKRLKKSRNKPESLDKETKQRLVILMSDMAEFSKKSHE